MSASKVTFAASGLLLIVSACSEPQCPHGYWKDGDTCRLIMDAEAGAEVELLPEAGLDSSTSAVMTAGDASLNSSVKTDGGDAEAPSACPGVCEAGKQVACTSSCGTQGTAMCTATCGVPSTEQCTAPKEVCNWIDDDCDGVVDPGMLKQDTSRSKVWTQATVPPASGTRLQLVKNPAGGAWFVFRSTDYVAPGNIQLARFDPSGNARSAGTVSGTENTVDFLVTARGAWT